MILSIGSYAQDVPKTEKELKERASELFEEKKFDEARPLYAQLLSLYTKDTEYNFKYGASLLESTKDKVKSVTYLEFATSQRDAPNLAYYYLGKAYHLNYNFKKAIKFYRKFKQRASKSEIEEYQVDRQIQMCENGSELLGSIYDVQVLDKQVVAGDNFYRVYELEGIKGKIISKPQAFMSKEDEKLGNQSIIYLPDGDREVYYSSYGKNGDNGRDIYKATKMGNNEWSEGVNLGSPINTPYDEDYAFLHPDKKTLYFASKGHNSMGGYDLFMSTYDESKANWSEPVNLDFAFSSVDDDILFISDRGKELAYFASNRNNDEGKITVYKVSTRKTTPEISLIKGKLKIENSTSSPEAKLTVLNTETNQLVGVFYTDKNGEYQISIPENGGKFKFTVETSANQPIHTGIVEVPKQEDLEVLGQELTLVGDGQDQKLQIKNIFDGSVAQQYQNPGELLSPEVLAKRASLDVNMTTSEQQQANQKAKKTAEELSGSSSEQDAMSMSDNIKTDQKQSNSGTKPKENIASYSNQAKEKLDRLDNYANALYANASELKNKADEKFNTNSATEQQEGKKLALRAALSFEQAERISSLTKEKRETVDQLEQAGKTTTNPSEKEQIKVETRNIAEKIPTVNELSNEQIENGKAEREELRTKISAANEKITNMQQEQNEITAKITAVRENSQGSLTAEEKNKIEALQVDSADLNYQIQLSKDKSNNLSSELQVYKTQEEELSRIQNSGEMQTSAALSDGEKDQLRNDLKNYRAENNLAYIDEEGTDRDGQPKETTTNNTVTNNIAKNEGVESELPDNKTKKTEEIDVSKYEETTIAPEGNSNSSLGVESSSFDLSEDYEYTNQAANPEVQAAKKAFQTAKNLDQAAEDKKTSIYQLETEEERIEAYEKVNALEKKSKEKQIEAIKKLSEANEDEFISNGKQLVTANNYSEDFNSSKLDVANLLDDEARNYFRQARDERAAVSESDRLSKQEVALQKAYDYEILALKKQRKALEVLEIVDQEYQNRATAERSSNQAANNNQKSKQGAGILKPQNVEIETTTAAEPSNISDAEESSIRQSQDYVAYKQQQYKLNQLKKSADVEYEKAVAIQNKKRALEEKASKAQQEAMQTNSEEERQRLIKEAEVLTLSANRKQNSIDSLNKIIRVKRYLIEKGMENRNNILSNIPQEQQASIIYLSEKYKNDTTDIMSSQTTAQTTTNNINRSSSNSSPTSIARNTAPINTIERKSTANLNFEKINKVPKQLEESIFVTIDRNASVYNRNRPIPDEKSLPSGLVYKVQVGAFRNPIPQDLFKGFAPLMVNELANGIKRYTAGIFTNEATATEARNQIRNLGYSDAFVVAYQNGNRINLSRAREISGESAPKISQTDAAPFTYDREGIIFDNQQNSESYTDVENFPKVNSGADRGRIKLENIEGVFYTVQLGVYSNPLSSGVFDAYEPLNFVILPNGMRRYNSGVFRNLQEARAHKNQLTNRVGDAFITAYYNGRRISISEAQRAINNN